MSLSLVLRGTRPSLLTAIQRGLIREGARLGTSSDDGQKRLTYAERQRQREELEKQRPTYKIVKGKKDITEDPTKTKSKSRKARFYDPDSSFAKRSLVYQMKTGNLPDEVKQVLPKDDWWPGSSEEPASRDSSRRTRKKERRDKNDVVDIVAELAEPQEYEASKERQTAFQRDAPARDRGRDRDPISIPYTTAASQFLYGRSVIEAALRTSRRQLYKLYLYGGANRQRTADDEDMRRLAQRHNVPVVVLDDSHGLRLMDKMASGRPHNGYVLEASALPQPPLTALGPLPDDYASKPGYTVTLAHQSAEDAAVNGTSTFFPVTTSSSHKPLIVILDQILDPGNLGAILRAVSFLGATAVGIVRGRSASLTSVALKASAGASESLTLFSIPSLPDFLGASRANGWVVYAAVAPDGSGRNARQRRQVDLLDVEEEDPLRRDPCVLLLGNEGEGLSRAIVKKADYELSIPNMSGSDTMDSLNMRRLPFSIWLLFAPQLEARQMPTAIRKMPPDQGAKFYHEHCAFADPDTSSPTHVHAAAAAAARRSLDHDDKTLLWANASAELPLRPPFALLATLESGNDDDRPPPWHLFRRARAALALLEKRQWACPKGTRSCDDIGYPNSCCDESETCVSVQDTGLGPVGCCPAGATCGGGVLNCADGSTACASEIGGGCCLPGYVCQGVGCVPSISIAPQPTLTTLTTTSTSVLSLPTPSTIIVTVVTTITPSHSPVVSTTTSTTTVLATGPGAPLRPTSSAPDDDDDDDPDPSPTSDSTDADPSYCPTGFYPCLAVAGGGCCQTGRDCATTSCPPLGPVTTVVNANGVTVVVPADGVPAEATATVGSCAGGWYLCGPEAGDVEGCCPEGYKCGTASCFVESAEETGSVAKVLPGSSEAGQVGKKWVWGVMAVVVAVMGGWI
ncbi:hypothetical protein VTJ49DRAFT_1235 [Mycothermus thermophilus]|uniref:rRNA methyltransferase 1, mitochondrial n=1 Tax=Humicola insolens TaxID=85995 RepID=A0ABR3VDD0_HUMIN